MEKSKFNNAWKKCNLERVRDYFPSFLPIISAQKSNNKQTKLAKFLFSLKYSIRFFPQKNVWPYILLTHLMSVSFVIVETLE